MSTLFHPPYQFIPVTGKTTAKVSYEEIAKGTSPHPIRHDMWQKNAYSGRLIASVFLETATVVGRQHEEAQPNNIVQPYCRNDQPAIPGNSLRGMIGSIAETLSQSALRILENKNYSVRKPIDSGSNLSALGLLRSHPTDKTCLELLPLTIPVQSAQTRQGAYQLGELWKKVFSEGRTPLKFCLPAYISGYDTVGSGNNARQQLVNESFLGKNPNLECFLGLKTAEKAPQYYYVRLVGSLTQAVGERIPFSNSALKTRDSNNWHFLLGQKIAEKNGIEDIITEAQYNQLTKSEQDQYTKGVLRILGIAGREEKVPHTKKCELFIPRHIEQHLPISKQALDNFVTLAKERETASEGEHPFKPQGYTDWHPQAGQLVFFDIAQDVQGQIYVSEISLSSIWRKRVEGSSHDFFRKIHQDCLPWNPDRNHLTPAECLFGVVEEKKRDTDKPARPEEKKRDTDKPARALASRLCFSDAQAVETVQLMPQVTLKILSSPKPPCPAMYFHPDNVRQARYIKKTELSYQKHRPNGRKVYLHHPPNEVNKVGNQYWESRSAEHLDQKVRCRPMQKGQTFYFHIDFENLSQAELGLLLRSLSPDTSYRHRLGLGKSLGLGTVAITLEGLFLIDRLQRYSLMGLESPRYHQIFHGTSLPSSSPPWARFYPQEAQVLTQAITSVLNTPFYTDTTLIDAQTLKILQTVGNPNSLHPQTPVSPPLKVGQPPEKETFKWFIENDRPGNQTALPAIQAHQKLPTLKQL